ncbi:MAG: metal-dependent transcriptional regulator [Microthrixaceae bacterium]|nr:metal-dependent transcriptional regulator [Microthrixaceae bacterium]
MAARANEYHPAFEEYCEAIWELSEDDIEVIQARIAERLEVSRPAVSEMIRRMEGEGLIEVNSTITLTDKGHSLAERVVRRHRLAERFLTDILGLSWADAHEEAGKWEHVISQPVETALARVLGDPTTCPHGNPIPGAAYEAPDTQPLSDVAVGTDFTITRIPEELEFTPRPARLPGGELPASRPSRRADRQVTRRDCHCRSGGTRRGNRGVRHRTHPCRLLARRGRQCG